ncbi:inorganic phosphate transporter [Anaeromusa sp.]|uniref:inorganic phosphate transporter n=1 Tax=Anaeromusa sp. TaxID=1872520 RepID=UPI00261BC4FB|nr:inorganic phosphate transporter [Anaeromusa sp.]MDD3158141.1 inorganic phosphate transporter [Anaeromusa sp.]MEA4834260.1 inorganic phosphate transporter [Anaeromusa sp.]NCB75487.1 inorganic phosphate transporter [Negativicutes bacterium]
MPDTLLIAVVVLALVFDYINGFHDTANAIATSVSTRALPPRVAVYMAACLNFAGAMYSTGVAKTIGSDIVTAASMVNEPIIIAAMVGAIFWNLLTWWLGIPSSSSHALIGGVMGAVIISKGMVALKVSGIVKIVLSLVLSPLLAIVCGFLVMNALFWAFRKQAPARVNHQFKKLQILAAAMMSFAHGSNDAQKAMGIITLALVSAGYLDVFDVPFWVKVSAALAMGCGTAFGGWRIIKTMGAKIFKLEPINGFSADINSSLVIFSATLLHLPVSTTHVVSGSIMGVGAAKRINAVRWGVAQQMVMAWVLTIPSTALVSALTYKFIEVLFL